MEIKPKVSQGELTDAFTGELFEARARNHYEVNDGVPFAPPVDLPRPTIRQRIENLTNRGADLLAHYVGTDDYDMDVPDDPEEPLTPSEANYIESIAAELAEAAPLPDEGLPRPPQEPAQGPNSGQPLASGAPAGRASGPAEGERPPSAAAPGPSGPSTVPTR